MFNEVLDEIAYLVSIPKLPTAAPLKFGNG